MTAARHIMSHLHTPDPLATLTLADLDREVQRLRKVSFDLEQQLNQMLKLQKTGLDSKVHRLLPRLSPSVYRKLAADHPKFLTSKREALFQQHQSWLGLWRRPGYREALMQLRAELQAHLEDERKKYGDSWVLEELKEQKVKVNQGLRLALEALQRCEARAPSRKTPGTLPDYLANRQGPLA